VDTRRDGQEHRSRLVVHNADRTMERACTALVAVAADTGVARTDLDMEPVEAVAERS
jgi:hypothetical protein